MADALNLKNLDNRLVQRFLRKGLLDQRQYDEYLKSLPDVADKATTVESAFEPTEAPQVGNAAASEPADEG